MCNLAWRAQFAEANVKHLLRTKSDHCPITICLSFCFHASPLHRPFRFEAMWLKHEDFHDFILQNLGQCAGSALDKSYSLVVPLQQWNLKVFGYSRLWKAKLLARLIGTQKALCRGPNIFLSELEFSLIDEFNALLDQEALFWYKKSRVQCRGRYGPVRFNFHLKLKLESILFNRSNSFLFL